MKVKVLVTQLGPTLCNPMDWSLPGSSIHGILQARVLEWGAIAFSRDLPDPGIEPGFPALQADSLPSEHQGAHAIWIFKMGLIAYNWCDFNPWTFCADRIMWVMASPTLSQVVLGSWLHNWIWSLECSSIHEGFTKGVITSSFAKYTLIFLTPPPSPELMLDLTLLQLGTQKV